MSGIPDRLTAALADRYRLERELGAGGMATVYLAHDLKHDRKVAIKVLKPELAAVLGAERFVQEIKTTAALTHPHILPLFDSGRAGTASEGGPGGQFLYYVMPYIEGETLRDRLNRETQLSIEEAVRITTEVADALQSAHEQGVIHRDIKPENILLHNGRPMVADFGIALAVSAASGGRMTETGLSLGTPHYMSPEQATADKDVTARSDVYSLGTVLYEMLTGNPPHVGSSAQQIIMRIVTDDVRPVTDMRKTVPSNVAAAVAQSLEKLPADRFASAAEFSQALTNPAFAAAAGASPARHATGNRSRMAYGAGLVLALLLGALARSAIPPEQSAPVLRLSINLEPGLELGPGLPVELRSNRGRPRLTTLAFAPDGRTLVFAGRRGGVSRLFRRSMSDGTTTPIEGTEGAEYPIFSPDGTELAFIASNWLRRVPLAGGTTVQIAEVSQPDLGGASWGDDGRIVFADRARGLQRVSATGGGSVETLLADDRARNPFVLPGSDAVLYTVADGRAIPQRHVEVLDIERGARDTVIDNASDARYVASGHLLFARVGQLMAVAFDPDRRRTTGAPIGILPDVMHAMAGYSSDLDTDAAQFTASAAGHLAWLTGGITPAVTSTLIVLDRQGTSSPIPGLSARQLLAWRLSPSGTRLALSSFHPAEGGLWVFDLERQTLTSLVDQPVLYVVWSPDGRRLVFQTPDTLSIIAADGGSPVERALSVSGFPAEWTATGELLYLTDERTVRMVDIDTGEDRLVVEEPEPIRYPTLSPDGRRLAYVVPSGEQMQLVVRAWPSLDDRQILSGSARQPAWTRGGRELLYVDDDRIMIVDFSSGSPSAPRQLFSSSEIGETRPLRAWDVSADGMRIVGRRVTESLDPPETEIHVVINWFEELKGR